MATESDEEPRRFGRYLLMERLARGGMGDIYLASHGLRGFEKYLVIKKIRPNLVEEDDFVDRFTNEADVAVQLQHQNIAQVFEVGEVSGEYYLALEHVDGCDLRTLLAKVRGIGGRFPADLALLVAREIASGLSYIHKRRDVHGDELHLVHCDVSPPNIMCSYEGETKIVDFGIARSVSGRVAHSEKLGFGKFGYLSPEQIVRGRTVDARTDTYALGVVLFEMLTGERLYQAGPKPDYQDLAKKVTSGEHPLPSDTDAELAPLDGLVSRALKPDPKDRYHDAAEFRDEIQRALVGLNTTISNDDLGLYVRHLFSSERLVERERRLRILEADPTAGEVSTSEGTRLAVGEGFAEKEPEVHGGASRKRMAIGAALVVIAVSLGLWFVLGSAGAPDPEITPDVQELR